MKAKPPTKNGAGLDQDPQALATLLQANYRQVLGYFIKLTQDPNLAQDLTQETMVKAIINIGQYRQEAPFASWLISIGANLYRDGRRRQKRQEKHYEALTTAGQWPPTPVTAEDNNIAIKEALLQLPLKKRTPLVLKYYYDFTYQEIAAILKIPVGTVRSRLHAAVRELRSSLAERSERNEE
ncbi:MAG: sigma-70 family RNA polymerase sigma factor [Firmicutes bacterium]|nr:sigma-70 family RNA polymerase sigma factor [Bacillota bacterium]